MLRTAVSVLTVCWLALGSASAAEYKNATIKGRGERGVVILEVDDQEIKVTPTQGTKAFDVHGKPFKGGSQDLLDSFAAFRLLKVGNVVNVKTEKSRDGKTEFIREIRLVKGELLQPGKASTTVGGAVKTYKHATVKDVMKNKITLMTEEGDEIMVRTSSRTQTYANGRQLSRESRLRVFKAGNIVDATVEKTGKNAYIVEARLVKGELSSGR